MNWGKIRVSQMNINQAKQRFTELTGLPAKRNEVFSNALYRAEILHALVVLSSHPIYWRCDARTVGFWITINKAIESYYEIKEVA